MKNFKKIKQYAVDKKIGFGKQRKRDELILFDAFLKRCNLFFGYLLGYPVLPLDPKKTFRQKINTIACQIGTLAKIGVLLISFSRAVSKIGEDDNLIIASENMIFIGVQSVIFLKWFIVLHKNYDRIKKIIEKLKNYFPKSIDDQIRLNTKSDLRTLEKHSNYHLFVYILLAVQFASMPLVHRVYVRYKEDKDAAWDPYTKLNLPLDFTNPFIYGLNFLIDAWVGLSITSIGYGTDILYVSLVHITSMEMRYVAKNMSEIGLIEEDESTLIERMKKLVEIHKSLIEIVHELDSIFSPLLLINMQAEFFSMTSTAFLAVSGLDNYFLIKYSVGLYTLQQQLFIHCYFGDILLSSSLSIAEAAYNNSWYSCKSLEYRRMVLFVMIRAQSGEVITALKFIDVTLESFYWIMNTVYSYFSFLKSSFV